MHKFADARCALTRLADNTTQARPFIKWAGGKTQLLDEIKKSLPGDFASRRHVTYVEPFVGGAMLFYYMLRKCSHMRKVVINDINENLVKACKTIKDSPTSLIERLKGMECELLAMPVQ